MGKLSQASAPVRLLEPLTSFRFFAAILVFFWHTHIYGSRLDKYEFGYIGVSFFFILSGFILTYVYTSRLGNGNKSKIKNFYASRIAKIYPVHVLTIFIAFTLGLQVASYALTSHVLAKTIAVIFANLSLTQSFYASTQLGLTFNGVSWSISDELFFYALFPLFIYLLVRYHSHITSRRLLTGWLAAWVALVFFIGSKHAVIDQWIYYQFPPLRLFDFISGVVLGTLFLRINQSPKNFFERLRVSHMTIVESAVLLALLGAILVSPSLPQSLRFSLFLIPFWSLVIFTFAWQKGLISKYVSIKPLIFLGNVSFSFYMIHQIIIKSMSPLPIGHHAIVEFFISLAAAIAIYTLFEEPYRLRFKAYLEQLTVPSVIPATLRKLRQLQPQPMPEVQPAPVIETVPFED